MLKEDIHLELSVILGWSKNIFIEEKQSANCLIELYLDTKLIKKDEIEVQHLQEAHLAQPEYVRDNNTLFNILESMEVKPTVGMLPKEPSKLFSVIGSSQDKVVTYSIDYSIAFIESFKEYSTFISEEKPKTAQTTFKKSYEKQNRRQENQLKHQRYLDKQTRLRNEKKQKQAQEKQIEVEVKSQKILNSQKKHPDAAIDNLNNEPSQIENYNTANIGTHSYQTQPNNKAYGKDGYTKYNNKNKYQQQASYSTSTTNSSTYGKTPENFEYKGQKDYSSNYYAGANNTGYKAKGKYEDNIDNFYIEPSQSVSNASGGQYQQKQSAGGYNKKKKK